MKLNMKLKFKLNVPNALTILRMIMIPFMIWTFINHGAAWAMLVYVVASATDVLDGYIARKYNQITDFGKLMDPLADKLMVTAMLIMLVIYAYIPVWVPIVVVVKEVLMVVCAALLLNSRNVVVMANRLGKLATLLFALSIVLVSLRDVWMAAWTTGYVIMVIAVITSVVAMLSYARAYLVQGRNDRTEG